MYNAWGFAGNARQSAAREVQPDGTVTGGVLRIGGGARGGLTASTAAKEPYIFSTVVVFISPYPRAMIERPVFWKIVYGF